MNYRGIMPLEDDRPDRDAFMCVDDYLQNWLRAGGQLYKPYENLREDQVDLLLISITNLEREATLIRRRLVSLIQQEEKENHVRKNSTGLVGTP